MRFRAFLSRLLVGALLMAAALPAALLQNPPIAAAQQQTQYRKDKLHPDLRKQVDESAPDAQLTVVIRGQHRPNIHAVKMRHDDAVAAIKEAAARSQGPILSYLQAHRAQVLQTFWLTNAVVARVDKPTLQGVANLSEVEAIHDNFRVQAPPVTRGAATASGEQTWGVEKIEAQRVWNELGVTGAGIRVAVLDTGVDISHPDLEGKMHSDNPGDPTYPGGWMEFDESGGLVASQPHDSDAHGTHVSGTVLGGSAGGTAIGVAPGATLMAGLVLPGGGGTFAQVVAGMQWAVEPTDANGNPAGQPPHVVSMSWGATGEHAEMIEPIRNMLFAGVLPVAAIGNCGDQCVGSPGAVFEAIGIGASTEDDSIADFSSGNVVRKSSWANPPDEWPDEWMKPNLSAPGVNVLSSVPGGGYDSWAGTSMATPHVSGTIALMLSANPGLSADLVLQTLIDTSYWDNRYGDSRPNRRYGQGRINAYEAVSRIAYNSGIAGMVTDADTGVPVDQAVVALQGTGRTAKTRADGSYTMVLPPGTYTLKISRFGYQPEVLENITVAENQQITANAALTPLPRGRLRGYVQFAPTGYGIPGVTVRVRDIPIKIEVQTDAGGAYEFVLPAGTYAVEANGYGFARAEAGDVAVMADSTAVQDLTTEALPRVGVIGDVDDLISRFLTERGYLTEPVWFDVQHNLDAYNTIVVNLPFTATADEFSGLVDAAHAAGVGMVFTKGYWEGWGIDMLRDFYGDPATTGSTWDMTPLTAEVTAEHADLLPGRAAGDRFDLLDCCPDMAWFDGYSGQTVAELHTGSQKLGPGIAFRQNANNRHVLLGSLGVLPWQGPNQWRSEARDLFIRAVEWAARPRTGGPRFVTWNLQATPDTVLWYQPVTATVGVKNIGDTGGDSTVTLSVNENRDSGPQQQTVTLDPNAHRTVSFTVQREPAGSYRLQVGHLSTAFRVRPPRVTVSAQTLPTPAAGKGKNADPGEPAIPLAGAQVDVVRKGKVIGRGTIDDNGNLTFDSTASRDDYTIVVRHTDYGYNQKRHYLLTLPVHVEDDTAYTFAPQPGDTAQLAVTMAARDPSHHGSIFLSGSALGRVAYEFPTGIIVATPGTYQAATVMAYDVPGTQWAYAGDWAEVSLAAGTQEYRFGGDLTLSMTDVRGQQAPTAAVSWSMQDAYGHSINSIYTVTSGAFGPTHHRVVGDTGTWPATVAATAQAVQKPVLTLSNPAGAIEQTGPIGWAERPRAITFNTATVATGDYSLLLQSETGPYMGRLQANAGLLLPARAVSRTLLRPGDTFEVTVVFDAGQDGELTLAETLPAGFTITKQSTVPNSTHANGTWTWVPSGKGAYRPGQTMKVTYTVQVGTDVAGGTYPLSGSVLQGGAGRLVAGPQAVQVVR